MFYWPYLAPLIVVCVTAMFGSAQMIRTGAAIFANWALGTAFVLLTGIYDPWWWFLALDAATAFVIMYHPAGRPQSAIGVTFIAQIIIHAVYAVSQRDIAAFAYWQILTWIAFVQLLLLGGWIVGFWWSRYFRDSRDLDRAEPHGGQGVAP